MLPQCDSRISRSDSGTYQRIAVNLAKAVVINSKDGLYDMEKYRNFMLLYSSSIYYYLQKKPSEDHCKLWSNAILYDCALNLEAECNQK